MARNRIKGITIEIGGDTTKLDKALKGTADDLSKVQAKLTDVNQLLKLDPKNVELLDQKQRLLAQATELSANKFKTLKKVAEESTVSNVKYKEWQKTFTALQVQITKTTNSLSALEKERKNLESLGFAPDSAPMVDVQQKIEALKGTLESLQQKVTSTYEELGRPISIEQWDDLQREMSAAGVEAENNQKAFDSFIASLNSAGDAAEGAGDDLSGMSDKMSGVSENTNFASKVSAGAAYSIGKLLVDAAKKALKELWNLDKTTEEYRENMEQLALTFEKSGYSLENLKETYRDFYSILGKSDTAADASRLLAHMQNREEELSQLTGILTDQYGALAASIPIDELVQAANEAARTGEVTGELARELELSGRSADVLRERLRNFDINEENGLNKLKLVTNELSAALLDSPHLAAEASDRFYKLAESENNLSRWTKIAAGVYATFGDSLPVDRLIEAADETSRTGKVTGALADALKWAGISEAQFNEQLEFSSDTGYRSRMIMDQLTHSYADAADSFDESNKTLIESRRVMADIDEATAELGEAVAGLKDEIVVNFGQIVVGPIKAVAHGFRKLGEVVAWVGEQFENAINLLRELAGKSGRWERGQLVYNTARTAEPSGLALSSPYSMRSVTAEDFPHLAQGTVTRANSPFMAVVGDNPQEPEIISPLSTIRQAVRDVVGDGGQSSNVRVTVNFTGSLAQFVRQLHPMITAETNRLGPQFVK